MTVACPNCGSLLREFDTLQNRFEGLIGTIWTCDCTEGFWHDGHGDLEDWYCDSLKFDECCPAWRDHKGCYHPIYEPPTQDGC